jgi:hypothetical protein
MSEQPNDWRQMIGRIVTIRKPGDVLDGRAGVILYPVTPWEMGSDRASYSVLVGGVVRKTFDLQDLQMRGG